MTKNRTVNLILILAGCASLTALAYALRYYHGAYYLKGRGPGLAGATLYFVLPALLAAFYLLSLRFGAKYRSNLALLTVTAGACLLLLDLAAGWLGDPKPPLLEEVERLRREGERAFPRVIPRSLFALQEDNTYAPVIQDSKGPLQPLGGISEVLTVLCNETGEFVTYDSDELGFNNLPGAAGRRIRVLALGDSFAHGFCVSQEDNFVSLIGRAAGPAYNLGAGGNGPLLELAGLKEYGPLFRPETVLWFFFEGNDLNNLSVEALHSLLPRYLEEGFGQNLAASQKRIDSGLKRYLERMMARQRPSLGRRLKEAAMLRHLRRLLGLGLGAGRGPAPETGAKPPGPGDDLALFKRVLEEAVRVSASWGGRLVFVYLPEQQRFLNTSRPGLAAEREAVLALARELGLPTVDLVPAFSARPDPLDLFNLAHKPSHYNPAGHALVAARVVEYLRSR